MVTSVLEKKKKCDLNVIRPTVNIFYCISDPVGLAGMRPWNVSCFTLRCWYIYTSSPSLPFLFAQTGSKYDRYYMIIMMYYIGNTIISMNPFIYIFILFTFSS